MEKRDARWCGSFSDMSENEDIQDPEETIETFMVESPKEKVMKADESLVMTMDEGTRFSNLDDLFLHRFVAEIVKDFPLRDPIFSLKKPVKDTQEEGDPCPQCTRPLKKKKQCKFCGAIHYGNCIKELRCFPGDEAKKHYPICDTCAFKLFLKELYDEYNERIEANVKKIQLEKGEFVRIKNNYLELHDQYKRGVNAYKEKEKEREKTLKDLEQEIKNSQKNQKDLSTEADQSNKQIVQMTSDIKFAEETYKSLETRIGKVNVDHYNLSTDLNDANEELKELRKELQDLRSGKKRQKGNMKGSLFDEDSHVHMRASLIEKSGSTCCCTLV